MLSPFCFQTATDFEHTTRLLTAETLQDIKSVLDYRCMLVGSADSCLLLSLGVSSGRQLSPAQSRGELCRQLSPAQSRGELCRQLSPAQSRGELCRQLSPAQSRDELCRQLSPAQSRGELWQTAVSCSV